MYREMDTFVFVEPFINRRFREIFEENPIPKSSSFELYLILLNFIEPFNLSTTEYKKCLRHIELLFRVKEIYEESSAQQKAHGKSSKT